LSNKPKRLYVPRKVEPTKPTDAMIEVSHMLLDALQIIKNDLSFYKQYTTNGKKLSPSEARTITAHVKSLLDLVKEKREQDKFDKFGEFTTDQLIEMLKTSGVDLVEEKSNEDD